MTRLAPPARKALLTLHVVSSVGWLGADLVLLTLGVAVLRGADPDTVYPVAALVATLLFAPLGVLVWVIGVTSALLTPWGLLRHRWVAVKLVLTTVLATLVLLLLTPRLRHAGAVGAALPHAERIDLVVAPAVSSTLMLVATVLSTYKPWGRLRRADRTGGRRPGAAAPAGR
ncbi:DUF2269 domain-containing protein [Micromonospora sp. BQ11]|uniref:DUF2269 domain-containing protein n=1 Tax=Micromonospora sp. BQ11 TaxID=3452212 RepID=UPI003F8B5F63